METQKVTVLAIPISQIKPSSTNPSSRVEAESLADLIASIRVHGVLHPVVVRQLADAGVGTTTYELVCGHRRHAAAKLAGLEEIPATVRQLADAEALELQIIENLQRQDLHPLDEAHGYRLLREKHRFDVARIAERVGRSVPYVYDRLRLNDLIPDVKKHLRETRITAGHAVVLARLKPADQKRALDLGHGGVFEEERLLWNPEDRHRPNQNGDATIKPRTVRQLQDWVAQHVKLDLGAKDLPDLFPELHTAVTAAKEAVEKIVPITHSPYVFEDARDGEKVLHPASWKRADGKRDSKTCEYSVTGVIVVGPGRGEAFKVCISKKTCKVHWAAEQRESKRRAAERASETPHAAAGSISAHQEKQRKEMAAREQQRARWTKAVPEIRKAVVEAIRKSSTRSTGVLGDLCVAGMTGWHNSRSPMLIPRGKTTDDLVRHLACLAIESELGRYEAPTAFPKLAKRLGVDTAKIVAVAAPAAPAEAPKQAVASAPAKGAKPARTAKKSRPRKQRGRR